MLAGGRPESLSNILARTEEGQEQMVEMEQAKVTPPTFSLTQSVMVCIHKLLTQYCLLMSCNLLLGVRMGKAWDPGHTSHTRIERNDCILCDCCIWVIQSDETKIIFQSPERGSKKAIEEETNYPFSSNFVQPVHWLLNKTDNFYR